MKKISEGAEAIIYSMRLFGLDAIVKVREPKPYRPSQLDNELRLGRTRKEARIIGTLNSLRINAPKLIAYGKDFIIMSEIRGKRLSSIASRSLRPFVQLGEMLGRMHNANIVHGDFTPANVIVNGNLVYVIDFGLSDVSQSIEDKAIDLLLMKRSVSAEEYAALSKGYASANKSYKQALSRLAEIEKRGRYQTRSLV